MDVCNTVALPTLRLLRSSMLASCGRPWLLQQFSAETVLTWVLRSMEG